MKFNVHSGARLQRGHGLGINFHRGPRLQRGHGIGSIFSGLFRALKPIGRVISSVVKNPTVRSIAKNVGKTALDIGKDAVTDIAADLIEGKDPTETAQQKLQEARSTIAQKVREAAIQTPASNVSEEPILEKKKKRLKRKKVVYKPKQKSKRYKSDIFS